MSTISESKPRKTVAHAYEPISAAGEGGCSTQANQNVTFDIPRGKPEEWVPCLSPKLKHSKKATDCWSPHKTFETSTGDMLPDDEMYAGIRWKHMKH